MIHASAPGKQMISGEWSVLEPGNACVVAAINKRVHVKISEIPSEGPQPKVVISLNDFGIKEKVAFFDGQKLIFSPELEDSIKEKFKFIKEAIEITMRYVGETGRGLKSCSIETWSEASQITVDDQHKKVGFGSSASAVVATVSALLELNSIQIEKAREAVYKLACAAHFYAQGKLGSAFDIATATYGKTLAYIAPNMKWVVEQLQSKPIKNVIESRWPLLHIQPVEFPDGFVLLLGWTKQSADTPTMIKALNVWKETNASNYAASIEGISEAVDRLLQALRMKDKDAILDAIKRNRAKLAELTAISGVPIETEELKKLADIADNLGGAGKLSGAGGGDCGIAVCFDEQTAERIKLAWKEAGLYPLDVEIDTKGVIVENVS